MLGKFARFMWGNFSQDELRKFSLMSVIFGVVIGVYWMLRPLKDAIFMSVVGEAHIPQAKYLSLLVIFPLVLIYSKLVDLFPRHRLFYALGTIYGILGLLFAYLAYHPTLGLANTVASTERLWGWAWYVYVESFGSLVVALFWAFAADTTTPDSAARGFPLVAFGGQLGNIFGPLFVEKVLESLTHVDIGPEGDMSAEVATHHAGAIAFMVLCAIVFIGVAVGFMYYFMQAIPKEQLVGFKAKNHQEEAEPGFFEGLKILVSSPYLLAIFFIISFYEVIVTVLDYNFKTFVKDVYPSAHESAVYLAKYGKWVGIISLLSILLGINQIQRLLGLGASLVLLPLMIMVAVLTFNIYPHLSVLFWIMVISKAINYALNQPSMKQLYIPISREAKYKSQAFVEMYGSRGSKAAGSWINDFRKTFLKQHGSIAGLPLFITYCTYVSVGIVALWIPIAFYLGRTFNKAVKEQKEIC